MATLQNKIVPHLWYNKEAREAAEFYIATFEEGQIKTVTTLDNTSSGRVDIVVFELFGQEFNAISAGPLFKFNESVSFIVQCDSQEEIDRYWDALCRDGGQASQCGWLKDKYGLSWQVVPRVLQDMLTTGKEESRKQVTQTLLKMTKLNIAALQAVYNAA